MFDLLGIDWGSVNCGFALASSQTKLILPLQSVNSNQAVEKTVQEVRSRYTINAVVIGYPTNMHLQPTKISTQVQNFKANLVQALPQSFKVILINERGSSKSYQTLKNKSQKVDSLSAAKILEFYFQQESHV